MSDDAQPPYEVGFGRPPEGSRFRKGQSGNPNGRRRKSLTKSEIIAKVRDEPIRARINGKDQSITFFEAAIRKAHTAVMNKGSILELERLFRLYEKHGVAPEQERMAEMRAAGDAVVKKIFQIAERTLTDDPPVEHTCPSCGDRFVSENPGGTRDNSAKMP